MLYYDRPTLVIDALKSILRADKHHKNWHLAFHDDASPAPGESIVRSVLPENMMDKVTFYRTVATKEQKLASGGMLGHVMNQMIKDSDAELAIILCDDDVLHEHYLINLNNYFISKPHEHACYSHVIVFDPTKESWDIATNTNNPLNYYTGLINPENKLDASQVAWRISLNKKKNAWFPYPCHKNHDSGFFKAMHNAIGPIRFSGFISQYKAIHEGQLSHVGQEDAAVVIDNALKAAQQFYLNGDLEEAKRLCNQILKVYPGNLNAIEIIQLCHE